MVDERLKTLWETRSWAVDKHRPWKTRLRSNDQVASGEWNTVWGDLTVERMDPQVENIYLEALTDKAQAADATEPLIHVGPTTGTKKDLGEKNAERKRKVFVSYGQHSRLERVKVKWFLDWWQSGAAYSLPWTQFRAQPRHPFFMRLDPRHVYPLAHDGLGNMTAGFVVRVRRAIDVKNEWGPDHEAFLAVQRDTMKGGGTLKDDHPLEEIWTYDTRTWSVALYNNHEDTTSSYWRYLNPVRNPATDSLQAAWLAHPEPHGLSRCPLVENKAASFDGEYRGPLDSMIPGLKTAQHIMARILEDVDLNIYSPVIFDNIQNPEDYGPNAQLLGTGQGVASVTPVRSPVNFEASQHVEGALEGVRNVGKYPQQRAGDPGGSVVSAKGVNAVQGSFNTEMATAQRDMGVFLAETFAVTAEFDERWCAGKKKVEGFDQGEMFALTYNRADLFKGDHRVYINYGGSLGLDDSTFLIRLATMFQNQAMSKRTFMQKSNLIPNVLAEENEMTEEAIHQGFLGFMVQQASEAGNMEPLKKLVAEIDGNDKTARAAVLDVIEELTGGVPAGGGGTPGPAPGPPDAVLQQRSLSAGGLPSSDGQAQVRNTLASVLPPNVRRAVGEAAPGGTAA
jgi:hypothetical protein